MTTNELRRALDDAAKTATVTPDAVAQLIHGLIAGDPTGRMQEKADAWINNN